MKISKRFWKLRLTLIIVVFALMIVNNTFNLNQQIVGLIQGVILPILLAPLAFESYQDKKWWLFTFASALTMISILSLVQSIYHFYVLNY